MWSKIQRSFEKSRFKTLIKANVVMPVVVLFFCFDFYPFLPDVSAQGLSGTSEAMPDLPSACVPVAFPALSQVFSFSLQLPSQLGYVFPETSVLSFHLLLLLVLFLS